MAGGDTWGADQYLDDIGWHVKFAKKVECEPIFEI
jgi:hypothetical protein